MRTFLVIAAVAALAGEARSTEPATYVQDWDYREAMRAVSARRRGPAGVVLHLGDSNTLHPAYSSWALGTARKSPEEATLLAWMHAGRGDALDGWTLCGRTSGPGRSATAANGVQLGQFLRGEGVELSLGDVVRRYNPQIALILLGTNDATSRRPVEEFASDLRRGVLQLVDNGTVPVLTTLPPHSRRSDYVSRYNRAIHGLAREMRLPLIDLYGEFFRAAPETWRTTLLQADGLHLTGDVPAGPLAEGETAWSGQLLRVRLTLQKLAEIKMRVFDDRTS